MYRHSIASLSAIVFAVLGLMVGCDKANSGNPRPASEVRLGYFANLTHAQAVLGVDSGEFAKAVAPAKLTTRVFNAGPSLIEALFAGEIDIGYVGPGPAITGFGKSRGQGLRVVSGAAANGSLIVARKDSGIKTLADLKDKKIATPQMANTQDISARHFVIAVLKQENAQNVVPVANAEQAAMMARGQIDVAWSPEPWGSRLVAEADGVVIAHEKDIAEMWPQGQLALTVVITTPEFLQQHRDVLTKVLDVHVAITRRLQSEPDKCLPELAAALYKLTGKQLPEGVLPAALKNVKFTTDPLEDTLKTMSKWTYELGFSRDVVDTAGMVDPSVLKKS